MTNVLPDPLKLTHIEFDIVDGVGVARLNRPGERMNVLGPDMAADLAVVVERCAAPDIAALVVTSAKDDNFLAGADIQWLRSLEDGGAATSALSEAHRIFTELEQLAADGTPTVAAIHGPCLGGGLELALACSIRISSDDPVTVLGLPEVKLGLLPGAGGTQRLPRLVGLRQALDLMLTGRSLRPPRAREIGLVDEVVPATDLLAVAMRRATTGAPTKRPRREPLRDRTQRALLDHTRLGRRFVFRQASSQSTRRTKGHYPAPSRILRVVHTGFDSGIAAGYTAELRAFGELLDTPQVRALLQLFEDTQALRTHRWTAADPRPIDKVGVIGGGLMGGGIAGVTVTEAQVRTRIKELDTEGAGRTLGHVHEHIQSVRKRRRLDEGEAARLGGLVTAAATYDGWRDVDVAIEAVFEDLSVKHQVLAEVEEHSDESTVFASNTSSLPIASIASAARRPGQVVGMHYFSPVEKMPLLEVVVTDQTEDWVTETAVALGRAQGKTVIVVGDGPGFYTTRVLAPFMNEVCYLIEEGVTVEQIDRAMTQWGFPIGPVTLMDEVGIDVGSKIVKVLADAFGDRMAPAPNLQRLVDNGRKGRKNGRGFYRYDDGKRAGVDPTVYELLGANDRIRLSVRTIQDRLLLLFVNEAVRCLEDGVLRSVRDGDVGAVMGLGFPPFRGGPFTHVDQVGAGDVVDRLDNLARVHGDRYAAADTLRQLAATGETFREGRG